MTAMGHRQAINSRRVNSVTRQAVFRWARQQGCSAAGTSAAADAVHAHTRCQLSAALKALRAEALARSTHGEVRARNHAKTTKAASRREFPSLNAAFPGSRRAGMD